MGSMDGTPSRTAATAKVEPCKSQWLGLVKVSRSDFQAELKNPAKRQPISVVS